MWHFSQFLSRTGHEIPLISSLVVPTYARNPKKRIEMRALEEHPMSDFSSRDFSNFVLMVSFMKYRYEVLVIDV
jgi:hypothetical protein